MNHDQTTEACAIAERLRPLALSASRTADPARPHGLRGVRAIVWDLNRAPKTTQADLLRMIGIQPDAPLEQLVGGLAAWNVFLLETNHLDDGELLALIGNILREEVALTDPSETHEYIACNENHSLLVKSDRDGRMPTSPLTAARVADRRGHGKDTL